MNDELRMLRSRAYGPAADIHSDPQALARLAELEDAHRAVASAPKRSAEAFPPPPPPPPPLPAGPDPALAAGPDPALAAPEPAPAEAEPADARGRRRRPAWAPRWTATLWPVSVIAALAFGAATTSAAMPLVSREGDTAQVDTLSVDPDFEWPEAFFGTTDDGTAGYQEFFGLTAMTTTGGQWGPDGTDACILLMATDGLESDGTSFSGQIYNGCGAGAFPATVVLTVDGTMPEALQSRFPVGTPLQFVFDGERVGVFTDVTG